MVRDTAEGVNRAPLAAPGQMTQGWSRWAGSRTCAPLMTLTPSRPPHHSTQDVGLLPSPPPPCTGAWLTDPREQQAPGPSAHSHQAASLLGPKTPPPLSPGSLPGAPSGRISHTNSGHRTSRYGTRFGPRPISPAPAAGALARAGFFSSNIINSAGSRTSSVFVLTSSSHRRRSEDM